MPEVIAKHFKAREARAAKSAHLRKRSIPESIDPHPDLLAQPDPIELVYNIRTNTFRTSYRSNLLSSSQSEAPLPEAPLISPCLPRAPLRPVPLLELRGDNPPLLCDGRMQIMSVPKWKLKVDFLWRTSNGRFTMVNRRVVRLPQWVWMERNLEGKWKELWIERC